VANKGMEVKDEEGEEGYEAKEAGH